MPQKGIAIAELFNSAQHLLYGPADEGLDIGRRHAGHSHAPRQRRGPSRIPDPQTESARDDFVNGLAKRRIRKSP
jgi:hypothetical protein